MTQIYAPGYISGAITTAARKQADEDLRNVLVEGPGQTGETILTIASGLITPTSATHAVDTEGLAASDDLTNIAQTNHPDGRWLLIRVANAGRVVTVKHSAGGAGQISLAASADLVLNNTKGFLLLRRLGALWEEVMRSSAVASPGLFNRALYGASTTWTKPAGVRKVFVEVVGGGGAGGGTNGTAAAQSAAGGGGGAGGYATKFFDVSSISSATMTVGAGATGVIGAGATGSASGWNDGTNIITAGGGIGGQVGAVAGTDSVTAAGGQGGSCSGGHNNVRGNSGGMGLAFIAGSGVGGPGGAGTFGGGPAGGLSNNGEDATANTGAGGGGAGSGPSVPGGRRGGHGGSGFIIVWEYA